MTKACITAEQREHIAASANGVAKEVVGEAVELAISLADKAIREGDEEPQTKVTLAISIGRTTGEWECIAEGKAERKDVVKAEAKIATYNPNQPDLPIDGE